MANKLILRTYGTNSFTSLNLKMAILQTKRLPPTALRRPTSKKVMKLLKVRQMLPLKDVFWLNEEL